MGWVSSRPAVFSSLAGDLQPPVSHPSASCAAQVQVQLSGPWGPPSLTAIPAQATTAQQHGGQRQQRTLLSPISWGTGHHSSRQLPSRPKPPTCPCSHRTRACKSTSALVWISLPAALHTTSQHTLPHPTSNLVPRSPSHSSSALSAPCDDSRPRPRPRPRPRQRHRPDKQPVTSVLRAGVHDRGARQRQHRHRSQSSLPSPGLWTPHLEVQLVSAPSRLHAKKSTNRTTRRQFRFLFPPHSHSQTHTHTHPHAQHL